MKIILLLSLIFITFISPQAFAEGDNNTVIQGIITIEGEIVEREKLTVNKKSVPKACSSWCQLNGSNKGCYTAFGMCVPLGAICQCKVGNTTKLGTVR